MARPKVVEDPTELKFYAETRTVSMLDLIGRAQRSGRPSRAEQLRVALEEYVATRMADESIREFVQTRLETPALKLHADAVRSDSSS